MGRSDQKVGGKNRPTFPDSTFDTFEPRRLLTVVLDHSWLTITGTSGDDLIVVSNTTTKVNVDVNDERHSFNRNLVAGVDVLALAGDDTIRNKAEFISTCRLLGGAGDDSIYGGIGPEMIAPDSDEFFSETYYDGNDTVRSGGSCDSIVSARGSDYIDGGPQSGGGDSVGFWNRTQGMTIHLGGKLTHEGSNTITLKNINNVSGTQFDDRITGNSRSNDLGGGGGDDMIFGVGGDDNIIVHEGGSDGGSTVHGGSGNDKMILESSLDFDGHRNHRLYGDGGNDEFDCWMTQDSSTVYGGSGDDTIHGESSYVFGGNVFGQAGNDTITYGLDGNQLGSPSRIIDGGTGSDHLTMSTFDGAVGIRITLDGIANDGRRNTADACNVRSFEWLTGGGRADLFDASLSPRGVRLEGLGDHDTLIGSNYADSLYGHGHNDSIQGNGGDDLLDGGTGNDLLDGGTGNDKLIGGAGIDTLFGKWDNDTISAADGLADIIDGGDGTDEADIDEGLDQTTGVEVLT